jgi:hypothetical protein
MQLSGLASPYGQASLNSDKFGVCEVPLVSASDQGTGFPAQSVRLARGPSIASAIESESEPTSQVPGSLLLDMIAMTRPSLG